MAGSMFLNIESNPISDIVLTPCKIGRKRRGFPLRGCCRLLARICSVLPVLFAWANSSIYAQTRLDVVQPSQLVSRPVEQEQIQNEEHADPSTERSAAGEGDEAEIEPADPLEGLVGVARLKRVLEFDAETRWGMLETVSPRGVDASERAEMVRLLAGQLKHDYPDIRAKVAEVLALFGADAAPAIPELMKLIDDTELTIERTGVWVYAGHTLASIGPAALDPLMNELPTTLRWEIRRNGDQFVAASVGYSKYASIAAAIAEMGEQAKSTAPAFIELLRDGPEDRSWATMFVLSKLGDAALPAIPLYIENLEHPDFNVKVIACRALAELGPASVDAVPKLLELLEKPNVLSTRTHAAMCLGAMGPIPSVDQIQIFTDMIQEPNAFSQERGLIALSRLGKHAANTESFLEELLEDRTFSQRPEVARTMWLVTGEVARPLEILETHLDDPTYDFRVRAVLSEMGQAAAPLSGRIAKQLATSEEAQEDQALRRELIALLYSMGKVKEHQDVIKAAMNNAAPATEMLIDRVLAGEE